jgi:2-iminobutanoate/2-iminopropanoate deaminase
MYTCEIPPLQRVLQRGMQRNDAAHVLTWYCTNKSGGIHMKQIIATNNAPGAIGPYSQAVEANGFIFSSGQLPVDPATGNFAGTTIEEQTRQSLRNVKAVLEAAGSSMDKVLKTTVFLSDMNNFAAMNGIYAEFFSEGAYPARSAVQVARLPKDALVEIEAVAVK